jgi:imidazolonepropionase-like amidohydrolase
VPGDDYGIDLIGMPHRPGIYASELSLYVNEAGIKPLDVLRWATRHGAELLGKPDELGVIAPGALADLVVVDGDPESDISVLERPWETIPAVIKDGVFVKDDLQELEGR